MHANVKLRIASAGGGRALQCKEILDMIMENSPLKPKDLMVRYDPCCRQVPFSLTRI